MRRGGRKRKDSSVAKSDDEDDEDEAEESKPAEATIAGYVRPGCLDEHGLLTTIEQHPHIADPGHSRHVNAYAIPQSNTMPLLPR